MDELAEIAASVAKALWLIGYDGGGWFIHNKIGPVLPRDGSNLFEPFWHACCRDWLLERGDVAFSKADSGFAHTFTVNNYDDPLAIVCPAAEFPARAIHAITSTQSSS